MIMAWTKEQEEAIYKRGANILVSAGAGSGKTTVLSARVLEYVKQGNSVKDLLILTFTKAAALEMKDRIYKQLKNNGYLAEANAALTSDITTFDAYSLNIVKKYYYLLGIDKEVGIADSNVIKHEKKKIITNLFNDLYAKEDKDFFNFLIHQNVKDDTNIIKGILTLSEQLELLVDPKEYLLNYANNYFNPTQIDNTIKDFVQVIATEFNYTLETFLTFKDLLEEDNQKIIDYLDNALMEANYCHTYEEMRDFLLNIKIPSLKKGTKTPEIDKARANITESIKNLKTNFFSQYESTEAIKDDILSQEGDIKFIIRVNLILLEEINKYKFKYLYFTYGDIAKMAIKLVKDFPEVRKDLAHLKEILVDEYQDTSDLQETFLSYIVHDNMYMVGDIKQSIYRFRNANPYIFKTKYANYTQNDGGLKIDLLNNFRSRNEVLQGINLIFNQLMTNELGDSNYQKDGQMIFGLTAYNAIKDANYNYNTEVLTYDKEQAEDYKREEIEAFICANKVKELVAKTSVYTKDDLRKTTYSDIAIIIDKATKFPLFKKIFEYLGVPLTIEKDLDIKDNSLTQTLIALLGIIKSLKNNNFDQTFKRNLTSVLRSFICNYNDEQIYHIIQNNNYNIELISKLKTIDLTQDSFSIYYDALNELNVYAKLPLIGAINSSLTIIDYIASMLVNYNKLGYDFSTSVDFLSDIVISDEKLAYKGLHAQADEVKLMTIHHSKGLEYPYCIFPLLYTKMNMDDFKKDYNLSDRYGIYLKKSNLNSENSALSVLNKEFELKKAISERVRLLYVALTRAREQMILILDKEETKSLHLNKLTSFKSMLDYAHCLNSYKKDINLEELNLTKQYNVSKTNELINQLGKEFSYSENDYHTQILNKGAISKETQTILSLETQELLDLGTNIHEVLASLDLKNPDYSLVNIEYQEYIKKLLAMPLFLNLKDANIYQEQEFYFTENGISYYGIMDLLLEYEDRYVIIDYKLSNLDKKEYIRQLGVYYRYLKTLTTKPIAVYLVSILKSEAKEITNEL